MCRFVRQNPDGPRKAADRAKAQVAGASDVYVTKQPSSQSEGRALRNHHDTPQEVQVGHRS